ncbi:MAG: hypothetical protein ABSF38_07050 [Verrucomicrobiota bacterium]
MSETANIPSTATATPAGSDCKPASCCDAQKQSQPASTPTTAPVTMKGPEAQKQPQTAGTPTTASATQKGFKRQGRKQH